MYYPARILNIGETKAELVRTKGKCKRIRHAPLKYLQSDNESSSENETQFSPARMNNVSATPEEIRERKIKKMEEILNMKAMLRKQAVVTAERIEVPTSRTNTTPPNSTPEKCENIVHKPLSDANASPSNSDSVPIEDYLRVDSSRELETLRKENFFLRDELEKKDRQLEETIRKLNEAISRLEVVAAKVVNEEPRNLPTTDTDFAPNNNGDRRASLNGQVTLDNGVTVCQKNLRIIRSMRKTPSIFVADLAELVFDKETLMNNAVCGKNKNKGKLCHFKIEAIHNEYQRWMIQDMQYNHDTVRQHLNRMNRSISLKSGWLLTEKRHLEGIPPKSTNSTTTRKNKTPRINNSTTPLPESHNSRTIQISSSAPHSSNSTPPLYTPAHSKNTTPHSSNSTPLHTPANSHNATPHSMNSSPPNTHDSTNDINVFQPWLV